MQALHCKLDVVLVQILRYSCSETGYSFCEDSPPAGLRHLPGCGLHHQTPSTLPHYFLRSAAPALTDLFPLDYTAPRLPAFGRNFRCTGSGIRVRFYDARRVMGGDAYMRVGCC